MRKNFRSVFTCTLCGVMTLTAIPVFAQDIIVTEPTDTFTVYTSLDKDALEAEIETEHFRIFGQAGEDQDMMLIQLLDGAVEFDIKSDNDTEEKEDKKEKEDKEEAEYVYAEKEELQSVLPMLDCDQFPVVEEVDPINPGTRGDSVEALQEALDSLGLLEGKIDLAYGEKTRIAVQKFQEERGLEATGQADLYTMLLITQINDGIEEEIDLSANAEQSPEDKFEAIFDKTDADLEPFMEKEWRFRYDEFEESGFIDPSIGLGSFEVEEPAIDQIKGELAIKVVIKKDSDTNTFTLVPAITVETEGAYRPFVKGIVLVGDDTIRIEDGTGTGEVDGVILKESAYIPLTMEAMELLETGSVHDVRLLGQNTNYDIEVEAKATQLEPFMDACETLIEE